VALPSNNVAAAMFSQQQPGTSSNPRLPNPMTQSAARNPFGMSAMARPMQNPFQQFMRPQQMAPVANPYYAAAAAHQQFLSQQNFLYSGLANPAAAAAMQQQQQMSATSVASTANPYSYALSQTQAMNAAAAQGLPTSMMQVPQMTSQPSQTGSSSAVVLNPYKKMKTS